MRDLGLDLAALKITFATVHETPYVLIEVASDLANQLAVELGTAVRRCYIADGVLDARHAETEVPKQELIGVKIPDRGSVMAGDFGEILTALFQAIEEHPSNVLDPKKWRLKSDRTKPAPGSDVVQFILPTWPDASSEDRLICSEVKTKSTAGTSSPIQAAIADSERDSDGRLLKTLLWLRERALDTGLGTVSAEQLRRFIEATDYPPAKREYRAVAVVCSSLVEDELQDIAPPPQDERVLVVITVPDLKRNYEAIYDAVLASVAADEEEV